MVIDNDVRVQWALAVGSDHQGAADTLLTSTKLGTSNQVNLANNVNNSFQITGVQLELGSTATDFEHRSFGQELQLCQRYYEENNCTWALIYSRALGNGILYQCYLYDTEMRAPTLSVNQQTAVY